MGIKRDFFPFYLLSNMLSSFHSHFEHHPFWTSFKHHLEHHLEHRLFFIRAKTSRQCLQLTFIVVFFDGYILFMSKYYGEENIFCVYLNIYTLCLRKFALFCFFYDNGLLSLYVTLPSAFDLLDLRPSGHNCFCFMRIK